MIEQILVLVRAIPELSKKYGYLVCVAGINSKNEWRRLYPFEFGSIKFKKKDWLEADIVTNPKDKRIESRKVQQYKILDKREDDAGILKILKPLISSIDGMKSQKKSLCIVKPDLLGIDIKINSMQIIDEQRYLNVYGDNNPTVKREKIKMPFEVQYIFKCLHKKCSCEKKPHKLRIIDLEINELFRNIVKSGITDKRVLEEKIKKKLYEFMKDRDLYFIIGTHFRFGTPIIIGLFYPKKGISQQKSLDKFFV